MAKNCTLLTEGFHTDGGTSVATVSISPSAGAVAVWAFIYGSPTFTATGNGLTYNTVINEPVADGGRILCLVGAGASPSAGVVTLGFAEDAFVNYKIVNITGSVLVSAPTNSNHNAATGTSTSAAVGLSAFGDSANGTLAYVYGIDAVTFTAGSGFAMVDQNNGSAMFGHSDGVMWRDSNDTTADATISSSVNWGIAALEIVDTAASGGSSTTVTPTSGTLSLQGRIPAGNEFTHVRYQEVLINSAGSPLSNRTGQRLMIWYNGQPTGAPDLSYSDMTTGSAGTASYSLATGSLVYGQKAFGVITDGGASLSSYTCGLLTLTYT